MFSALKIEDELFPIFIIPSSILSRAHLDSSRSDTSSPPLFLIHRLGADPFFLLELLTVIIAADDILRLHYVPGTMLSAFHAFTHVIHPLNSRSRYNH